MIESISIWTAEKAWWASLRQLESYFLVRVTRHYCIPLASFDFRGAFVGPCRALEHGFYKHFFALFTETSKGFKCSVG